VRVAIVHSFYSSKQPSGENRVVEHQAELLSGAGHDVRLIQRDTDTAENSLLHKPRAAFRIATGLGASPLRALQDFQPDVTHVHNLFPNFGTSWARAWPGPMVVSLHNYRSVCARADLYRDGTYCQECIDFGNQRAVTHACYRNSRLATLPIAMSRTKFRRDFLLAADAVVTTSGASDTHLRQLIGPELKSTVIPNPGSDAGENPLPGDQRHGWLAMGRLSEEKGFIELINDWPANEPLTIIGSGPLEEPLVEAARSKGITHDSAVPINELRGNLAALEGFVFPSRWIEVAPQVVVEAMRVGLPVIAYAANGIAQLVTSTRTGLAYTDSQSLHTALENVRSDLAGYSSRALAYYRNHWSPDIWLDSMCRLYEEVATGRNQG